jgi:mitochondrial chaperone BCS1
MLDGMVEMPGRMIVITSNHPEMLDPALVRKGRIDFRICFGKMTRVDVQHMYRLWFNGDIPEDVKGKMLDRVFTQAELGNLFASGDLESICQALQMNKQRHN